MNWKLVVIGGVLFYLGTWLVVPISGPLLHEGILADDYQATAQFWRPELTQQPPDMAALLPRWIATGLIAAFIVAAVYGWVRSSFAGAGWLRGLKFGAVLALLTITFMLGYSGVFNLPDTIWAWWWIETLVAYLLGGIALGWVADKVAPAGTT